ncbi:MAG: lysyl oxidase family protein, partial [Candidatus Limnocylindria bacterium]
MSLARGSRASAALVLALGAVIAPVGPMPASAPALAGGGVLPDLAMAALRDFRIEVVGGRRLLRFTGMLVNIGQGHFEVRGSRSDTSQPMTMSQVIYETTARDSPIAQQFVTSAVASYAGDGHNHWHVNEMTRYDMWGDEGTFRGEKIGLCFLDSDPWDTGLPGHVGSYYTYTMCSTDPAALSNRMGVSVGWADEYEWFLAWQWIDITGVPAGIYTVRAKVDPYGYFLEADEGNQCAWTQVSFSDASNAVNVHQQGGGCVNDVDGSIFASDIGWAYAAGITVG